MSKLPRTEFKEGYVYPEYLEPCGICISGFKSYALLNGVPRERVFLFLKEGWEVSEFTGYFNSHPKCSNVVKLVK